MTAALATAGDLFGPAPAVNVGRLSFVPLAAEHFFALELQDRQRTQYGLDPLAISWAEAEHYASQANAWCALREGEPLAVLGVNETFPGVQGVAFALLGKGLGRDHLALTRFARDVVIGQSPLKRIEAIVPCEGPPPELSTADNQRWLMHRALLQPTPEVRWSIDVGFTPTAVLRKFGAASETHMLLERIR